MYSLPDVGRVSVETPAVFLKTEMLRSGCRPVNAFLMEISHVDPFWGIAGEEGEGGSSQSYVPV